MQIKEKFDGEFIILTGTPGECQKKIRTWLSEDYLINIISTNVYNYTMYITMTRKKLD